MNSVHIPGAILDPLNSRTPKHVSVPWALREGEDEGVGMGVFPVLEAIGHSARTPSRNEVQQEMTTLLRNFSAAANYNKVEELREAWLKAELPPNILESKEAIISPLYWPKFKTPTPTNQGHQGKKGPSPGSAKPKPSTMVPTMSGKYSGDNGLYNEADLGLDLDIPDSIRQTLVQHANASLSYQTWRSVKGVKRRIMECEAATGASLAFPWSHKQTTIFTGWCL